MMTNGRGKVRVSKLILRHGFYALFCSTPMLYETILMEQYSRGNENVSLEPQVYRMVLKLVHILFSQSRVPSVSLIIFTSLQYLLKLVWNCRVKQIYLLIGMADCQWMPFPYVLFTRCQHSQIRITWVTWNCNLRYFYIRGCSIVDVQAQRKNISSCKYFRVGARILGESGLGWCQLMRDDESHGS